MAVRIMKTCQKHSDSSLLSTS
ncbi:hypothetical protein ACT4UM_08325 [Bacillus sp. SS-TM]